MTSKSKDDIKAFFETGDKPTEAQFVDFIDSYVDKSGPIGTIETAASAGSAGFARVSGQNGEVLSDAATRTQLGITVYTTAQVSAVVPDSIPYATTAQAVSGLATGVVMDPVLTKNAIASLSSSGSWTELAKGTTTSSDLVITLSTDGYTRVVFYTANATGGSSFGAEFSDDGGLSYITSAAAYNSHQIEGKAATGAISVFDHGNEADMNVVYTGALIYVDIFSGGASKSAGIMTNTMWLSGATVNSLFNKAIGVRKANGAVDTIKFTSPVSGQSYVVQEIS